MALTSGRFVKELKRFFGHSRFRPHQEGVIAAAVSGKDTVALLPTSAGKSLCYQMTAMLKEGTTFVVSPLVSLMVDQVHSLEQNGIAACYLGASQIDPAVESNVLKGQYKLVYITPEKLDFFMDSLVGLNRATSTPGIALFAIDEAHCVSHWGHDFRPAYRKLSAIRDTFPKVPIMALTATATQQVLADVEGQLKLDQNSIFRARASFDRPNLFYEVKRRPTGVKEQMAALEPYLGCYKKPDTSNGSAIVYVISVADTVKVANMLSNHGIKAAAYNGKMTNADRHEVHMKFVRDEIQVVVATVSFGMGIDKSDVRTVIHYGSPKTLEQYYQESGRAGRDGEDARCVVFFSSSDRGRILHLMFSGGKEYTQSAQYVEYNKAQMGKMEGYFTTNKCRRAYILDYFNEEYSQKNCGRCDNCTTEGRQMTEELDEEIRLLLECIAASGGGYGLVGMVNLIRGSTSGVNARLLERTKQFQGKNKKHRKEWWTALATGLVDAGYLKNEVKARGRFPYVATSITAKGSTQLKSPVPTPLIPSMDLHREMRRETLGRDARVTISSSHRSYLFGELFKFRARMAKENNILSPSHIISGEGLRDMARLKPTTLTAFLDMDGINEVKAAKWGALFLAELERLCKARGIPMVPETESATRPALGVANAKPVTSKKLEYYNLFFKEGLTLEEVAKRQNVKQQTALSNLLAVAESGDYAFDWARLPLPDGIQEKVVAAMQELGPNCMLRELKEYLSQWNVSYDQINIARSKHKVSLHGVKAEESSTQEAPSPSPSVGKKRKLPSSFTRTPSIRGGLQTRKKHKGNSICSYEEPDTVTAPAKEEEPRVTATPKVTAVAESIAPKTAAKQEVDCKTLIFNMLKNSKDGMARDQILSGVPAEVRGIATCELNSLEEDVYIFSDKDGVYHMV